MKRVKDVAYWLKLSTDRLKDGIGWSSENSEFQQLPVCDIMHWGAHFCMLGLVYGHCPGLLCDFEWLCHLLKWIHISCSQEVRVFSKQPNEMQSPFAHFSSLRTYQFDEEGTTTICVFPAYLATRERTGLNCRTTSSTAQTFILVLYFINYNYSWQKIMIPM